MSVGMASATSTATTTAATHRRPASTSMASASSTATAGVTNAMYRTLYIGVMNVVAMKSASGGNTNQANVSTSRFGCEWSPIRRSAMAGRDETGCSATDAAGPDAVCRAPDAASAAEA